MKDNNRILLIVFLLQLMIVFLERDDPMYGHTYSKSMDQSGKVANPARGQLNRESQHLIFPSPL